MERPFTVVGSAGMWCNQLVSLSNCGDESPAKILKSLSHEQTIAGEEEQQ